MGPAVGPGAALTLRGLPAPVSSTGKCMLACHLAVPLHRLTGSSAALALLAGLFTLCDVAAACKNSMVLADQLVLKDACLA